MSEYWDGGSAVQVKNCICHQSIDDIQEYVNIVCYYSCKLCDYSCTDVSDIRSHVAGSHLNRASGTERMVFIDELKSDGNAGTNDVSTVQMPSSELPSAVENEEACAAGTVGLVGLVSKEFSTISQSGCDFLSPTLVTHSADPLALQPLQSTIAGQTLQFLVNNQEVQLNCFSGEGMQDAAAVMGNVQAGVFANGSHASSSVQPAGIVQAVGTSADHSDIGPSAETSEQVTEMYACDSCLGTVFSGVGIIEHMLQVHGIRLDSVNTAGSQDQPITFVPTRSMEVAMPPNTVSIGTQAQLAKKPGRKRKATSDVTASLSAEEQSNKHRETTAEKDSAAAMAVKTLGIERLTAADGGIGLSKRRIQPPRALVEDYHILRLRQSTPRTRSSAVFVAPEIPCSFSGCRATFRHRQALEYHVKCHTDSGPFRCPECRSAFDEWSSLMPHLWTVHGVDLYAYQCCQCDFRTDCFSTITEHTVAEHDASKAVEPFPCSVCGQTFRKASLRKQHEKSHNSCSVFSRTRTRSELTAFRRCICDVCKRSFANRKSLSKHVEVNYLHNCCEIFVMVTTDVGFKL